MKHLSIANTQLINTESADLRYHLGMTEIHERLRERREKVGLSQGQVAEYEGLSKSYISKLEGGQNLPNVWPLLLRLAKRYKTSTDYLLGLTDNPAPINRQDVPADFLKLWEIYQRLTPDLRFRLLVQARLIDDDLDGIVSEIAINSANEMLAQMAAYGFSIRSFGSFEESGNQKAWIRHAATGGRTARHGTPLVA